MRMSSTRKTKISTTSKSNGRRRRIMRKTIRRWKKRRRVKRIGEEHKEEKEISFSIAYPIQDFFLSSFSKHRDFLDISADVISAGKHL